MKINKEQPFHISYFVFVNVLNDVCVYLFTCFHETRACGLKFKHDAEFSREFDAMMVRSHDLGLADLLNCNYSRAQGFEWMWWNRHCSFGDKRERPKLK